MPGASPATVGLDEIVDFLLDRAVLTPEQVLAGVVVDPVPRRNSNLRVSTADGSGVFVKQADGLAEGAARTVRAEGAFYAAQAAQPPARRLPLPRLVHSEPTRPLLVLELLEGHRPLLEHAREQAAHRFPIHTWRRLGEQLRSTHGLLRLAATETAVAQSPLPWVVATGRPFVGSLCTLSRGALAVIEVVQRSEPIRTGLRLVQDLWQPEQVIHGDVRADNVLVRAEGGPGPELCLVDWELHRLGDPLWDVAGALDILVLEWLYALATDTTERDAAVLTDAILQAASCALWEGYVAAAEPLTARQRPVLQTLSVYCAARLVETAVESTGSVDEMSEFVVLALQVAENLFADREHGATRLFGIG
jgi:tRNA A-37 threonylcarbamoyl transferase component Bud32